MVHAVGVNYTLFSEQDLGLEDSLAMVLDATKAGLNCSNASPIHPQEAQNRGLNQLGVIVQVLILVQQC